MTTLRLIHGGQAAGGDVVEVRRDKHDELHAEIAVARAERLTAATEARNQLRAAARHLAKGRLAACATSLLEATRIVEREADRATAMDVPCACGTAGSGHGPADSDALAVPVRRVA